MNYGSATFTGVAKIKEQHIKQKNRINSGFLLHGSWPF
jgi:hypothetical protein